MYVCVCAQMYVYGRSTPVFVQDSMTSHFPSKMSSTSFFLNEQSYSLLRVVNSLRYCDTGKRVIRCFFIQSSKMETILYSNNILRINELHWIWTDHTVISHL